MIGDDKVAMAGPRLTIRVAELLRLAHDRSGMTQKDIACALGVGEARVSQILNGDGNLHLATVARVFAAMGFDAEFKVFDDSETELRIARRSQRRTPQDAIYSHNVQSADGKIHTVSSWAYRQVEGSPIDFPLREADFLNGSQENEAERLIKSANPKSHRVVKSELEPVK